MSTLDGLVRFDGLRFRIFNRQNAPALTTNGFSFFALLEDRQGCLWAGTLTGGVIRYCNGAFTSLTVKDGLPNNTVVRIDEDEAGTVWIFMLVYPMSTGRNFDEVLRVLDSIQLTATHKVATPVNWKHGEDVIIVPAVSDEEAKQKYPGGWRAPKHYLRFVAQPS